jgi:hypothetical protein
VTSLQDAAAGLPTVRVDLERERLAAEHAAVTEALASTRLELQDVKARFAVLTRFHDRLLAPLYAELDDVQARIAELLAARSGSAGDHEDAAAARAKARESASTAEAVAQDDAAAQDGAAAQADDTGGQTTVSAGAPPRPRRSDRVRTLFRTLIKLCHPDLATGEQDRLRREEFTARVNSAYASNDAAWLADLAKEWESGATGAPLPQHDVPELRAALDAARRQLAEVRAELARLTTTGLGELFGSDDPYAAVQRIAGRVRTEIGHQWDVLRRLRGGS